MKDDLLSNDCSISKRPESVGLSRRHKNKEREMVNKRTWLIVLFASILVLALGAGPQPAATVCALSPTTTVPYSGRLGDEAGQSVVDGAYDLSFALYEAPEGGNSLWSETQTGVAVQGGSFTCQLGSVNPLPAGVQEGQGWLAVGVRGPEEAEFTALTPRQAWSASPASPNNGAACPHDHFGETWTGTGLALALNSSYANNETLYVTNNATSGDGIRVYNSGTASDDAALEGNNLSSGSGVYGKSTSGLGVKGTSGWVGVWGESTAAANGVGVGGLANASGCFAGIGGCYGVQGSSTGGYGVEGYTDGSGVAVHAFSYGSGVALRVDGQYGGNLIEAYHGPLFADRRFYVTDAGQVYADGQFHPGGADLAEMLPAGDGLEPGDVLAVGADGKLARSTQAYQTSVVGVYSTKPGFVGGAEDGADLTGKVPLAVVGVAPVKVTAENGPIHPGDLLVASSTPGHAMKAGSNPPVGTVIGKALAALQSGSGVIQALVTLQ
jgi:hypothetical protein